LRQGSRPHLAPLEVSTSPAAAAAAGMGRSVEHWSGWRDGHGSLLLSLDRATLRWAYELADERRRNGTEVRNELAVPITRDIFLVLLLGAEITIRYSVFSFFIFFFFRKIL